MRAPRRRHAGNAAPRRANQSPPRPGRRPTSTSSKRAADVRSNSAFGHMDEQRKPHTVAALKPVAEARTNRYSPRRAGMRLRLGRHGGVPLERHRLSHSINTALFRSLATRLLAAWMDEREQPLQSDASRSCAAALASIQASPRTPDTRSPGRAAGAPRHSSQTTLCIGTRSPARRPRGR